jgi:hypothetical protein
MYVPMEHFGPALHAPVAWPATCWRVGSLRFLRVSTDKVNLLIFFFMTGSFLE